MKGQLTKPGVSVISTSVCYYVTQPVRLAPTKIQILAHPVTRTPPPPQVHALVMINFFCMQYRLAQAIRVQDVMHAPLDAKNAQEAEVLSAKVVYRVRIDN